ncbi:hypothetical protein JTE90_000637 [Oedothorax gibbosus]|uniref:BTB domain-containing protein n=1 Tax=Oedothorax gibbosus TaxID=931172 RepID=A0AAV6VVC7_9ARAC|nr:hypothetical protein JTE90_000637 [Oedothorax gibbosus]
MLPHQKGEYLGSPFFTVPQLDKEELEESSWCLHLYPRDVNKRDIDHLQCYLVRKNFNPNPVEIGYSLKIESVDGSCDNFKFSSSSKFVKAIGFLKFVPLKLIHENQNLYLPQDVLTIKCFMWLPETEPKVTDVVNDILKRDPVVFRNQCFSVTRLNVSKRSVTWPVTKVKERVASKDKKYFHIESALESSPSFKLSISLYEDSKCEYAHIDIAQTKIFPQKRNIYVKCKITIISAHEQYQPSREDSFLFHLTVGEIWRFPDFITTANLKNNKYIHLNDTLYLECEFSFTFGGGDSVTHVELPTYFQKAFKVKKPSRGNTLNSNFRKLYLEEKFCDVSLRVDIGNKTLFTGQKIVLCAQSPVFYAMFEKNPKTIEIVDVDAGTMKLLLEFLHTDEFEDDLSTDNVCKLYSAAYNYQILSLKEHCTLLLLSSLSVANVCEVLVIADTHQDNFLMAHVHNFLKRHGTACFQSLQWEKHLLENPNLFGKVMIQVLKQVG